MAKGDAIYHHVRDFIADEEGAVTRAINLVEFSGNDVGELERRVSGLCQTISPSFQGRGAPSGQATGYYATRDAEEMNHLWDLRKKGAGLLGNTQGNRRPLPFVEDTAVPPENLAAYIAEFTAFTGQTRIGIRKCTATWTWDVSTCGPPWT